MATPSNRVPVRVARGTKANLDTAMAAGDLKEGEIVYATDEDGLYVVESGVLAAAATAGATAIDGLSDVDTSTTPPTDGQVLGWNNANSEWEPVDQTAAGVSDLGGLTDVTFDVYAGNTTYVNDSTPDNNAGEWYMANGVDYISYNNAQSGAGKMGELQVGDVVTITYSDASTEDLTVLNAEATNSASSKFIRFTTNAASVVASGGITLSATGRWTTQSGEVLGYDGSSWVATSTLQSVGDLSDTTLSYLSGGTELGYWDVNDPVTPPAAQGEWRAESYDELRIFFTDADGTDIETAFDALPSSGSVWIIPDGDGSALTEVTYTGRTNQTTYGRLLGTSIDNVWNSLYDTIRIYTVAPTLVVPADGSILAYSSANSDWRTQGLRTTLGIGEYADDAAAGTGGVASGALYYNTTSSDYRLKS